MRLEGFEDVSAILQCGVYALCLKGRVIYVGKAKCGLPRIASHRHNRGKKLPAWAKSLPKGILFDEVHFRPVHPDRVDEVERQMIDRFRPKLNVALKPPASVPISAPVPIRIRGIVLTLNSPPPPPPEPLRRRAFA